MTYEKIMFNNHSVIEVGMQRREENNSGLNQHLLVKIRHS